MAAVAAAELLLLLLCASTPVAAAVLLLLALRKPVASVLVSPASLLHGAELQPPARTRRRAADRQ